MGRTRKRKEIWTPSKSPAQKLAKQISRKYKSPHKVARKALYQVFNKQLSIRKAAREHNISYSSLQRRTSELVDVEKKRGPETIFNKSEEETMAKYLSEMAQRGMGLRPTEFLDFVENIMKNDKRRKTFKDGRPSWDWYYAFMKRNKHIVQKRKETPLEISRAKVTTEEVDGWFHNYRMFMSDNHLMDKPERVYNADETGFTMGSKSGEVIGPAKKVQKEPVPHVSGGRSKERVTVMYCANAEGSILPPFFVFARPKPTSYDLLAGSHRNARAEFTDKGWMDAETFRKFIHHLHAHAVKERPIVLLIDSVGSHVDMESFSAAKELGIEIYRLVRNATHLMQPLDVGVYGPMKKSWYKHLRDHTRHHPEDMVRKQNFARHLQVAFMDFYKPVTVQKSFATSGVFPVDRSAISDLRLKPSLTYEEATLSVDTSTACTPTSSRATTFSCGSTEEHSGLDILAQAASAVDYEASGNLPSSIHEQVSPLIVSAVKLPTIRTKTAKRKRLADELPDNLTSENGIRMMGLKSLEKAKSFASKERKARERYLKSKENVRSKGQKTGKGKQRKKVVTTQMTLEATRSDNQGPSTSHTDTRAKEISETERCFVCHADESEPGDWIQCDLCRKWEHILCIPAAHPWDKDAAVDESVEFICHNCTSIS